MRRSCLKPYMRRRFNFVTAVSLGSFLGLFSVLLGLLKIQNVPSRNHTLSPPPDPCCLSGKCHLTSLIPLITSFHQSQPSSGNNNNNKRKTLLRFPFIQIWSHKSLPNTAGVIYSPSHVVFIIVH